MSPNVLAALRATLEGMEAQLESIGAAVEAALSMLGDEADAPPSPPPAVLTQGRIAGCAHTRTEQAGGFGGNPMQSICVDCGALVASRR